MARIVWDPDEETFRKEPGGRSQDTLLDEHGQPVFPVCAQRVEDRTIDELIGICKGIVADNVVSPSEADFLVTWLEENRRLADVWPVSVLITRIRTMLEDGVIYATERAELLTTLKQLIGGKPVHEHVASFASALPLDTPPPAIHFPDRRFCLTGQFAFGPRAACAEQISARGGLVEMNISLKLDYLVVGLIGSRDWAHSTHGRKIEKAVAYKAKGCCLAIVGEDHWANFL